ncbi:hypothetical protein HanIR_Chr17g0868451 [Helianthus annuus]|nr:hypothetical protein HanIR_Chr17g0868451 [Helianthus annuus]
MIKSLACKAWRGHQGSCLPRPYLCSVDIMNSVARVSRASNPEESGGKCYESSTTN